jgi:hypothetical protein
MRPDNTTGIINAARRRHELTRAKAIQALRELDRAGMPVTFAAVANRADISRSWLYNQPDLQAEIRRLREATRQAPGPPVPAHQRATDASLLARLHAAHENNRKLAEENQRLRRQLAQALGEQRTSARSSHNSGPNGQNPRHPSVTIGPC